MIIICAGMGEDDCCICNSVASIAIGGLLTSSNSTADDDGGGFVSATMIFAIYYLITCLLACELSRIYCVCYIISSLSPLSLDDGAALHFDWCSLTILCTKDDGAALLFDWMVMLCWIFGQLRV